MTGFQDAAFRTPGVCNLMISACPIFDLFSVGGWCAHGQIKFIIPSMSYLIWLEVSSGTACCMSVAFFPVCQVCFSNQINMLFDFSKISVLLKRVERCVEIDIKCNLMQQE